MREVKREDKKILHLPDIQQRPTPLPGSVLECDCARVLGNDFLFLPVGTCLRPDKRCDREAVVN